ncbi:Na/Pi cotransporter family protein [Diaphorobacter nitroreducens]|uniref:Na/Pi cotransporter family protein n=1 Tax=Diaphorobacter nitroreducens TaxID=164759 RepID=UPI0028A1611B|nr:Na/Pi cotransporter family protein [Diaphorobacter nitroreducens]
MKHLLNLLAAIALLVWGIQMVRTGILRVFGANLRQLIAHGVRTRLLAVLSGIGVTAVVQSSTATALIVSAFVGQGMISLMAALTVMLGADVGSALMAVVFSLDLSWLSPLCIFVGVVLFVARQDAKPGRVGRVLIGLGLMLLALRLITESTLVLTQSEVVRALLMTLTSDITLEVLTGAILAVISYSSLATVLLVATLAGSGGIPTEVALGLVVGANLGSGVLAVLTTLRSSLQMRQVPIGNLLFKMVGALVMIPLIGLWHTHIQALVPDKAGQVVLFHLAFNFMVALLCLPIAGHIATAVKKITPKEEVSAALSRPHHLDASALSTPSLAISCAAREALHLADLVETMLGGLKTVWQTDDQKLGQELRALDDQVDSLYSAIKYYMTKISRSELDEGEGRRWTEIISFTINMEQIGDLVERVLQDVEDKKIKKGRQFSHAGLQEINEMHDHLVANLRLAMSVFLTSNVRDAQKLLEEKNRFRELELAYAATHLNRLAENTIQSIETSSLHIDIISDLKRINSLLCSVAYPVLEANAAIRPLHAKAAGAPAMPDERL